MQLAFAFPKSATPVNNRAMATSDSGDANKPDAAKKLRNKALRLLTTREHSREELLRKLAQAKARRARQDAQSPAPDKDEIERVVDELAAQGWQSDDRYAEAIVRRLTGQASRRFIEDKLAQTGIKKDAAKLALESLEQDDAEVARALWARRFGEPPADDRERQRQIRFLLSRGFHLGDAFKLVPKAVAPSTTSTGRLNRQRPDNASSTAPDLAEQGASPEATAADTGAINELTRTSTLRKSGASGASGMNRSGRWGASSTTRDIAEKGTSPDATATDSGAVNELTRTSTLRKSGMTGSSGLNRSSRWGSSSKSGSSISGAEGGGSQLRRSTFKRARPWGARNDADPTDADGPAEPSEE